MPIFALNNLSSQAVRAVEPWALELDVPATNKKQFIDWGKKPSTSYCFYSGYEGLTPSARISKSNPALKMHAVVADYDSEATDFEKEIARIEKNAPANAQPNWVSRTFSGGLRIVWILETPLLIHPSFTKAFLKKLAAELKLKKLQPGFDEGFFDVSKYYALGTQWTLMSDEALSENLIETILLESTEKTSFGEGPSIPINVVAAEVESKFPGAWPGAFELGARGPRFWDANADNPTAAIVREEGMQCFTGDTPFVRWRDIFGESFVKSFEADRIGGAVKDIFFDGRSYWKRNENGVWVDRTRQDIGLSLKKAGLSGEGDVDALSEIEYALLHIQDKKHVDAVVPLVHMPDGIVNLTGRMVLNRSRARVLEPRGLTETQWGDGFPWLSKFLEGLFDPQDQLDYWLAWLQRFYGSSRIQKPLPGQAIFIAGDVEQGKTFLTNVIISKMVGGHADASDFLLGDTTFNGHLFETSLWTVDDTTPGADPARHTRYSAIVKKMPANRMFLFNNKFQKAEMIPWSGRVAVTCNTDSESARILPDIEQSLLDKVSLFKVASRDRDFTGVMEKMATELPAFCQFLLHYEPPHEVLEHSRYGVACYHHPELLQAARDASASSSFFEILTVFLRQYFDAESKATVWEGTGTDLLQQMALDDGMKPIIARLSPVGVGRSLGQLKNQGFDVEYTRANYGIRHWRLPKKLAEQAPKTAKGVK